MIDLLATDIPYLLTTIAILLLAGFVHGSLGLGFPMVATPLLALSIDVRSTMLILLLPTMAINCIAIVSGGRWRESIGHFWPLGLYGAIGSIAGTHILTLVDPAPFRLVLAAVILLYLYTQRFGLRMQWVHSRPASAYLVFGLAGGLLAGTVNVMVPALIILFLELEVTRQRMVQAFNFCFLLGKSSQAAVFWQTGFLTTEVLLVALPLTLVALFALFVGLKLSRRINAAAYQQGLRHVLLVIAVMLIGQYLLN